MISDADRLFTRPFTAICLAAFFFYVSFYALLTILPLYVKAIGGTPFQIGLIIGLFAFVAMLSRPPAGWMIDTRGVRIVLVLGMLVFVIASFAYMAAHSVVTILIVRLFHGLGMGLFPTAATVVVAQVTPPTRRGEAMGWFGIANGLGFMLGPGLGSPLAAWLGFPALFTASGLAAAAGLGCLLAIPNTSQTLRPTERLPRIADLFSRPALLPSILVLALCIPYGTLISFLPLISLARGLTNAGAAYTVFAGAVLAIRAKAGSVSDRRGRGAVIIPGLLIEALAFLLLGLTADWVSVLGGAALYGVAFGSVQPALLALTVDRVRTEDRGKAMATFYTAWEFGIAVGSSGAGLILQAIDFSSMLLLVGVIPVAGMLLALKLRGLSAAVAN